MAQCKWKLNRGFDEVLCAVDSGIVNGSASATREGASDSQLDGVRCSVRVYERYSVLGGNRLSMNITLFGRDGDCTLSAITSGGSQAVFLKLNTFGEQAFLDCLNEIVARLQY